MFQWKLTAQLNAVCFPDVKVKNFPHLIDPMVKGLLMQMMILMVGKEFLSFWDTEFHRRVHVSPSLDSNMSPLILSHSIFVKFPLMYTSVYA
jgi:hypothetical protein